MAFATVTIDGFDTLRSALRALAHQTPALVSPCLTRALEPVARRMEAEAPKLSGHLAGSVGLFESPARAGHCHSEAVSTLSYAGHVDLGTSRRAADDFLERAFDSEGFHAARNAEEAITGAISRAMKT